MNQVCSQDKSVVYSDILFTGKKVLKYFIYNFWFSLYRENLTGIQKHPCKPFPHSLHVSHVLQFGLITVKNMQFKMRQL